MDTAHGMPSPHAVTTILGIDPFGNEPYKQQLNNPKSMQERLS
jgi:hypothetical protein